MDSRSTRARRATGTGTPRLARQALGYLLVGGLVAVVDIGLFHQLAPRFAGLLLPAALSFIAAAIVNYSLSSLWVYRRQWRSLRRAIMFMLLASIGLCINVGATWFSKGCKNCGSPTRHRPRKQGEHCRALGGDI